MSDFEWTVFDEGDADTIRAALTGYATEQSRMANGMAYLGLASLVEMHTRLARTADRLVRSLDDVLYPEADPDSLWEEEPPLPKDDPTNFTERDYSPLELRQIRSQSGTLA